jgi:hypothetical protein
MHNTNLLGRVVLGQVLIIHLVHATRESSSFSSRETELV